MKVLVCVDDGSPRSKRIAGAMRAGVLRHGHACDLEHWNKAKPLTDGYDVVVGYGWAYPEMFEKHRAKGRHFVHIDLGWWGRKPAGQVMDGYHKVAVDGRDPAAYFAKNFPGDRAARFGIEIKPWRDTGTGAYVIVGGMSEKAAGTWGYKAEQWERAAIFSAKKLGLPVVYRPKPSWRDAKPIPGTTLSIDEPLEVVLRRAAAVLVHHSNAAVDALLEGVPAHVAKLTVASAFSTPICDLIRAPIHRDGREQLVADIAYCQFSPPEMERGECWAHLKEHTPLKELK